VQKSCDYFSSLLVVMVKIAYIPYAGLDSQVSGSYLMEPFDFASSWEGAYQR
jgi:hypothetical protein